MLDSQADREYIAAMQCVDESFRTYLEQFCDLLGEVPDTGELVGVLGSLSTALHRHFELEEQDGYLGEAVAFAPRLATEADRLLQQHPMLSEELTSLHQNASIAGMSDERWASYVNQAHKFVERLIDHERAENDLVQTAYEEDIGDKD